MSVSKIRDIAGSAALMQQALGYQSEDRSPEKYQNEVQTYIADLNEAAPVAAVGRAMASHRSRLVLHIENPTETNFRDLRLRVSIPGPVVAIDAEEEESRLQGRLPKAPRIWGSMRPPATLASLSFLASRDLVLPPQVPTIWRPRIQISHNESATLTFEAIDVRPRDVIELAPFHLFPLPELVGASIEATWEATSTSADGVVSGVLPIRVRDEPLGIEQLLNEDSLPEDKA
jgi:hypothetical protein